MRLILRESGLEPLKESFLGSVTVVVDWALLLVGWVEFDGWEARDIDSVNFVGGGVHLGDD